MLDRLETSDRAQRRFVADASHELRSPLAALTTTAEVADADASGTMWPDVAPALRSQAQRMGRLVEDLLTLATVDDDGAGTAPQDRERGSERFVPLDDCRARDTGGSGPGLAITRGTVAARRGSVRAVEGPEDRCRFLVRLPVTG